VQASRFDPWLAQIVEEHEPSHQRQYQTSQSATFPHPITSAPRFERGTIRSHKLLWRECGFRFNQAGDSPITDILTLHLPVPVPVIKTISRWKVFLALLNPRAHFTTCTELRHQICREVEATGRLQANQVFRNLSEEFGK